MVEQDKQQILMRRALAELRDLRRKLAQYQKAEHQEIAVIGLACRFPGGCDSPEALWQFLSEGKNARIEVPSERWSLAEYYSETAQSAGKISSRYGAFLSDIAKFDADFFAIAAREAEQMDPQQRLLLETSWQAFERTGIHPKTLRNSQTGVFIGSMSQEYSELIKNERAIDLHTGTGNAPSIMAGRLAYFFGLKGPAMVIDTACSSSLMAVHQAVKSLRSKEIDMALAGGANLQLSVRAGITESQAMMLANDGLCKTFDEKANGIGRGDGIGLVVLKRLSDAVRDGDPVCAVIKGSAANHDGRSSGLTVPSERAQEAVLKSALADAKLTAEQVSYIEAHGTGTSLGDPIEVSALNSVLSDRPTHSPLYIGSLKTNFGHMEGAAGIAGFIKTILMLQHESLVPHLNFNIPSSHISWQDIPIKVVTDLMPWPVAEGQKRVAGVSAFGLSGTNVHVLLEQAPDDESHQHEEKNRECNELVFPLKLSANSTASLTQLGADYQAWLQQHEHAIYSVCYHAARGRADFKERAVVIGANQQQFEQALFALSRGQPNEFLYRKAHRQQKTKLAVLFTGQGSQYPGMTADLYHRWPVFKQAIDQCENYLQELLDIPLKTLLFNSNEQHLQQTCYAQPAIFAVDYALYQLWQSWGIEADALMGHSLGEYVAACLAGVFSLEDALQLVVHRAQLMQQAPEQGGMLAVSIDHHCLTELLGDDLMSLDIAAINSAQHCVLSGLIRQLDQVQQRLEQKDINCKRLDVSHGFHSRLMQPVLPVLQQKLESLTFNKPYISIISNLTGSEVGEEMTTASYWLQHCRQPVLFAEGIKALQKIQCGVFLECGARPILSTLLMANGIESDRVFASVKPHQTDSLLHCAAQLYVSGLPLKWEHIFTEKPKGTTPVLPVYPFSGKHYWLADYCFKADYVDKQEKLHPLLHKRIAIADSKLICFESYLSPESPAYLSEHQVFGYYLTPLAVLLEMLVSAGQLVLKSLVISLKNINIEQALVLSEDELTQIQVHVETCDNTENYEIKIFSRLGDNDWQQHITAVTVAIKTPDAMPVTEHYAHSLSVEQLYQQFREKQIVYGENFKQLKAVRFNQLEAMAQFKLFAFDDGYALHPGIWDGCMQTAGVAMSGIEQIKDDRTWLPIAIERIDFYQPLSHELKCHAQDSSTDKQSKKVNIQLSSSDAVVLQMHAVTFHPVSEQVFATFDRKKLDSWFYQSGWQLLDPAELTDQPVSERFLCIGSRVAKQLINKLKASGCQAEQLSPEQLLAAGDWVNQKTVELDSVLPLHFVYCAEDFVTDEPANASLVFLAFIQAIEKQAIPARVTVLSSQAVAINQAVICAAQNAVMALLKTAALEFPQRHWLMLDIADINAVDEKLLHTLISGVNNELQLAIQGEHCYTARLKPAVLTTQQKIPMIMHDQSYLVTGGSGALGLVMVEYLIKQGASCIVVASRKGLSEKMLQKLQTLAEGELKIVSLAVDLSLQEGIEQLLAELKLLPTLSGVIHAAGVLKDTSLLNMSQSDFRQPWLAKVNALQLLDQYLPSDTLEFFVLFSSLAAITGAPGQGNYAAANAYADALMINRKNRGLVALTINWSGWSGTGMLAGAEDAMKEKGFELIQSAQGLELFERLLKQTQTQIAVMPIRWPEFFAALPYKVPNFYQQQMLSSPLHMGKNQTADLIQQLNQADITQRINLLEQAIRQNIAQVLRDQESANLGSRERLFDIGFDSLLAVEFTRKLSQSLDIELPSTLLFDYPTLEALLSYLIQLLPIDIKAETDQDELDSCSEQELSAMLEKRLAAMD